MSCAPTLGFFYVSLVSSVLPLQVKQPGEAELQGGGVGRHREEMK